MEMYKVALVVALVAISASAAPLYQQQVDLFDELLQEDAAPAKSGKTVAKDIAKSVKKEVKTAAKEAVKPKAAAGALPFDHITTKQEAVYAMDKTAHDKYNAYETTKRLAPFKVSAARDKAENAERKVQDADIKTAKTAMDKAQVAVDNAAVKTDKAADKQATTTKEKEMEKIHHILHPKKHEQEVEDKDFFARMAKQAAGASVVINADTEGNYFRPGGLGDHPEFAKKKKAASAVKKEVKDAVKAAVKDQVAKAEKAAVKKAVKKAVAKAAKKTMA